MAHKDGYLELKNKNAKPFMKMVGKTVTIVVKGKVTRAEMQHDYDNDGPVIGFTSGEDKKTTPAVDIDVSSAVPQKKPINDMTNNEFEHEIVAAKTGD